MGFRCGVCGEYHDELPMDIAFMHPAEYFTVPEQERAARVYFNEDYCVIDNEVFVIRGILPLPVIDSEKDFAWGVWAIINEADFKKYLELWGAPDAGAEPPFLGMLSGGVRDRYYPDSDLLPVAVQLRSGNARPIFKVISDQHALGVDQRQGITMEKVHSFVSDLLEAKSKMAKSADPEENPNENAEDKS